MVRAAETNLNSDLRLKRNSYLVAGLEKIQIQLYAKRRTFFSSDLRPRGNSDLVAGLVGIQI